MTEDLELSIRPELMHALICRWGQQLIEAELVTSEAMLAAAQFLATVVITASATEGGAHETLNKLHEANHLFINSAWSEVQKERQKEMAKRAKKERANPAD
jgi:hypothetical protein